MNLPADLERLLQGDWPRMKSGALAPFAAQLNFAEFPPLEVAAPKQGILAMFATEDALPYACVWYPEPKASAPVRGPGHQKFEYRLTAEPSVTVSLESYWLELWNDQREESFGSLTHSVVVRLADFEAGRLGRLAVVTWQ